MSHPGGGSRMTLEQPGNPEVEEARVDGPWKVNCRGTAPGGSGSANGEFSRMAEAIEFAEGWLGPGWTATLTNPLGEQVELVKGKRPVFRAGPGKVDRSDAKTRNEIAL